MPKSLARGMVLRALLIAGLIGGAVFGLSPTPTKSEQADLSPAAASAQLWGFDYDKLLGKAKADVRGPGRAFLLLAMLTSWDAGPAEGFEYDLGQVLAANGDEKFAEALGTFSAAQRGNILWWVEGDAGIHNDPPEKKFATTFTQKYPRVAKMMREAREKKLLEPAAVN